MVAEKYSYALGQIPVNRRMVEKLYLLCVSILFLAFCGWLISAPNILLTIGLVTLRYTKHDKSAKYGVFTFDDLGKHLLAGLADENRKIVIAGRENDQKLF